MSDKSKLIKSIVKKNEGENPSFGSDPRDPWSAKANINETPLLNRYLKSRGINPQFATKDQKVAHSKTNQFKIWMRAHMNDPITMREGISQEHTPTEKRAHALKKAQHVQKEIRTDGGMHSQLHSEAVDKKDTVTLDIPLLIRVLELAREDLKSDMDLHRVVEKLIEIRNKGVLTMDDYDTVAHIKESIDQIFETFPEYGKRANALLARHSELYKQHRAETDPDKKKALLVKSSRAHKLFLKSKETHLKRHPEDAEKLNNRVMSGISDYYKSKKPGQYTGDSVEHPADANVIAEISSETLDSYKAKAKVSADALTAQGKHGKALNRWSNVMKATGKQIDKTTANIKSALNRENLEPMAACNQPGDGANTPDDVAPKKLSTAKKVKLLLGGKKQVTEDLYDHEKEDKPVTSPGKKPKFQKPGMDAETKQAPPAAAVLSGGKTLTGEPRDTIEIDPMMKTKKQALEPQKNN
jgi:hypothetical protein